MRHVTRWLARGVTCLALLGAATVPHGAAALPEGIEAAVVSVLPVWPGHAQGGAGAPPGTAPEGSGVVLAPGIVATAWHVIAPAERIDLRLSDGRILPARLLAQDAASDIAVLSVAADLPPFEIAPRPRIADPVCTIGNAWGLGLSVTCGVVSALDVSQAGFNPVEHFVQTDAATNPGTSGGALVDAEGRLVGMMSAIFASEGETDIGVNFAVSGALLERVVTALRSSGDVRYPKPGWRLAPPDRAQLARLAAPVIAEVSLEGNAAAAGLRAGDVLISVGAMRTRSPRDVTAALALLPESETSVDVMLERDGRQETRSLPLWDDPATDNADAADAPDLLGACPHPDPVCAMRQAVFPVSSFDPVGSATRIGPRLLVINRHVVGDRRDAVVHTPNGPRDGRVLASAYAGDLVLIEVDGLPETGLIPALDAPGDPSGPTFAIGADVARSEVRVFDPGRLIAPPADGAALGRWHVTSTMQPGVSGGALVDASGLLAGISVGGGEGRFEALPLAHLRTLLDLRSAPDAEAVTARLGGAFATCAAQIEAGVPRDAAPEVLAPLVEACARADNAGQLLEAGRVLAMAGAFDGAVALHSQAVRQVPNSLNSLVSLMVSLQLSGRFEEMTELAARAIALAPEDPQVLRFAIQSGVWGGAPELAEQGYAALLEADPMQAQAARRFIDNAPPRPARR